MLFYSSEFLIFFCIAFGVYFFLCKIADNRLQPALTWLALASLFFCGYSRLEHILPLIGSATINFILGRGICSGKNQRRQWALLTAGITLNIGVLGYFKYSNFFIANINALFQTQAPFLQIVLPLGISYYTFQQIAYLVDCYKKPSQSSSSFIEYVLFVSFFPKLLSGPIMFHHETVTPLKDTANHKISFLNVSAGIWLFSMGFFKKVVFADTFSLWVNNGYASADQLSFWPAWTVSLLYTLQLYFDFSGYCDMATGVARMFNIHLPINFDSPYKSESIRDFWKTWHITLGRFLVQYLYYPLGGSHKGVFRTYINILLTFMICGLWHGASWTFVIWGMVHGVAVSIHRAWGELGMRMPRIAGIVLTFLFMNCSLVLPRAENLHQVKQMLLAMFTSSDFSFQKNASIFGSNTPIWQGMVWLAAGMAVVFLFSNAIRKSYSFRPSAANLIFAAIIFTVSIFFANLETIRPFIYLNF